MPAARRPDVPGLREPRRLGPRARRAFDVTLVAALLAPSALTLVTGEYWVALLCAVQTVPLLWRRSHPVASFVAVVIAHLAQLVATDTPLPSQVVVPISVYSVCRFGPPAWSWVAVTVGGLAALVAAADWQSLTGGSLQNLAGLAVLNAAVVLSAWSLGSRNRVQEAWVGHLVSHADEVRRNAERDVALAASQERARIAREMHDVVAHSLSVVVVQADGARYAAAQRPEAATEALSAIAATGRSALGDMRHLLGVLRSDDPAPTVPQPGLGDLRSLLEAAGGRVRASMIGLDRPISSGTALTVYRIVQESLTNVRKHAGPDAVAQVDVTVLDHEVQVSVLNDTTVAGRATDTPTPTITGAGLGLVGMRERVEAVGGTLTAGPHPDGTFLVSATLPT